tara:strand:+ start:2214 stop:3365 length:1152 start_codon:yes stop_codon:yes gene_type:complete
MIPLSVPNLKGKEKKYLKECIDTEFVSSVGKFVNLFEKKISKYTNSKYAVACTSGTAALHLSLRIIGIKSQDEVIVPTMTFIATANVIKYLNASPIFMDCDEYYNIDVKKLLDFLKFNTFFKNGYTYNKKTKKIIKAIIPVHVSGNAVNLKPILNICKKKNILIIEDAAEALGTFYIENKKKRKHVGTIGDVGCLSFNGNKIITSGGGGMIITNNKELAEKARYLSTQATNDSINYIHDEIGYNYRLTNIQAAVGLAQLEKINLFIKKKKYIYNFYKKHFKNTKDFALAKRPNYANNNGWMVSLILKKINNIKKNSTIKKLLNKKIQTRSMWLPIHMQKQFKGYQKYKINKANNLFYSSINIPCSTNITNVELTKVVKVLKNF